MRIISGKTRFGKPILHFGTGKLKYKGKGNVTHELIPTQTANIYYIGPYTISLIEDKHILELNTAKTPDNAIRFLLNKKKIYGPKEYDIDGIRIKNPENNNITSITIFE